MKNFHFIGAGGIGISALAGIALAQGHKVSGCDRYENAQTRMLSQLGSEIFIGHDPLHTVGADEVIYTSAMASDHPELLAAGSRLKRRGEFLAELMAGQLAVGIAGTHGKTTTTWLVSHILIAAGKDPTVLVGGEVSALNGNFRVGSGPFVSELDESDGSFLLPDLSFGAITNIESEHLAYYGTLEKVVKSFNEFSEKMDGHISLNLDCQHCREIFKKRNAPASGYGLKDCSGYHFKDISGQRGVQRAKLYNGSNELGLLELPLPGEHNLYNALCAISVAAACGVEDVYSLEALKSCCTVGRRMEFIAAKSGVRYYSDYAHHPTEVNAAIRGARDIAGSGLAVVFQPHLYSRTRDYAEEFAGALTGADKVVLVELYPAREEPIAGVDAGLIGKYINKLGGKFSGPVAIAGFAQGLGALFEADDFDTVVFMGAGDIDKAGRDYVAGLPD